MRAFVMVVPLLLGALCLPQHNLAGPLRTGCMFPQFANSFVTSAVTRIAASNKRLEGARHERGSLLSAEPS